MKAPKKMDVGQKMRHEMIMKEIQDEYESDTSLHLQARQKAEGMRSSQISALVGYLIKKGVL